MQVSVGALGSFAALVAVTKGLDGALGVACIRTERPFAIGPLGSMAFSPSTRDPSSVLEGDPKGRPERTLGERRTLGFMRVVMRS